ncbi:MAG: CpsB/CapC family capsule biosynthesis tyrosine phosphatase, partial [Atopobiaceae bacterium]|nr:CpsB/CapC family capsule biosynthesis tyrosine phosphatase [Atopobiaceae bacterium]
MHCHILPGVDDGAEDMEEALAMFSAARKMGVTSITCTPHCRDPYFDYLAMWRAFRSFESEVHRIDPTFPLQMGFEVNYRKLMELGLGWAERLHFDGTNEFLLELSVNASPTRFGDYERTIFELQGLGYDVIIAHPERYEAVQRDIGLAKERAQMGCKLQASADFIKGGRFGREKRPAVKMFKEGLYTYIASDAHYPAHYTYL